MVDFDPLFLVQFPYKNMLKIEVFDTFLRKSIVMVNFDPYFLVRFPYGKMVKIEFFHTLLRKSIEIAESRVILTPIFSTIPL